MEEKIISAVERQNYVEKCSHCGNTLHKEQQFCPNCGKKVAKEEWLKTMLERAKKNKRSIIIFASLAAVITVLGLCIFLLTSSNFWCSLGKYQMAYKIAKNSEKNDILAENVVAIQSGQIVDSLREPETFKLKKAYFDEDTARVVLYVSAENPYGEEVSQFWFYAWSEEDAEWTYQCAVESLEEEPIYSYYDEDTRWEIFLNNYCRIYIKDVINKGIKLDTAAIDRINNLVRRDKLNEVEHIEFEWNITKKEENSYNKENNDGDIPGYEI